MTELQFEEGFLRIASRTKESGTRRSKKFERRYTGAKGIGRLAAHKLAALLEVQSTPDLEGRADDIGVLASIDWDAIERFETLDDVSGSDSISVRALQSNSDHGTTITLRRLRKAWTGAERARFLAEVETFSPPPVLMKGLPRSVLARPLLFDEPTVRDSSVTDPGFAVHLEGDLTPGEDYWQTVAEASSWVVEVDATRTSTTVGIAPTVLTSERRPGAERRIIEFENDLEWVGPQFQARVLIREGRLAVPAAIAQWASRVAGVRVFLEGFRVLPYGERSNDWLSLDSDYARRSRVFEFGEGVEEEAVDEDAALRNLPNAGYFGAVFLTENRSSSLRMLVNREGFVPDAVFHGLAEAMRRAVSLSVRVRSAAPRPEKPEKPAPELTSAAKLRRTIDAARAEVDSVGSLLSRGATVEARGGVGRASGLLIEADTQLSGLMTETSMLRVLASVGTQMAAFVHEVRGLVAAAEAAEAALDALTLRTTEDLAVRRQLQALHRTVTSLRQGLDRQASYLVDVLATDARRRRSRQPVRERVESVMDLLSPSIGARGITVSSDISDDATTPPIFRAEFVALLVNLLSNAVKAAGSGGRISIRGSGQPLVLRVENSGDAVDLQDSERWFRPFESSSNDADPVLGQGMGMGLPISRRIVLDYGGTIEFVAPSQGMSTAIEVRWRT